MSALAPGSEQSRSYSNITNWVATVRDGKFLIEPRNPLYSPTHWFLLLLFSAIAYFFADSCSEYVARRAGLDLFWVRIIGSSFLLGIGVITMLIDLVIYWYNKPLGPWLEYDLKSGVVRFPRTNQAFGKEAQLFMVITHIKPSTKMRWGVGNDTPKMSDLTDLDALIIENGKETRVPLVGEAGNYYIDKSMKKLASISPVTIRRHVSQPKD